jgi:hypothetical protein
MRQHIFILFIIFCFLTANFFAQNTLVSQGTYFEGEPYLAINRQNQQQLVAAWMGFQVGNKVVIKSSVSTNGGMTWTTPTWQPHDVSTYSSADVSVKFDNSGNVFMSYIDYDNELFTAGKVVVRKSTDGGITWGNAIEAISLLDCPNKLCIDRPWMEIDCSGGPLDGTIYITNMNAKQPTLVTPPYNPYVSVSTDNGASFASPRFLDTLGFLSGPSVAQPMPSPAVTSNGKFYAIYPSYVPSQSPFARMILASSTTACVAVNHQVAYQSASPFLANNTTNSLLKAGYLLRSNPNNPNHLAFFFLSDSDGDADIKMMETSNAGITWSAIKRINQDPIANGKLQDLLWADFDSDGDLLVCWRDRRNGLGTSYAETSEIYAAIRPKDSLNFNLDYPISSQQIQYNSILENSGNDFMNTCLMNDTAYSIWGDVRSGSLKIYLHKWNIFSQVSTILEIPIMGNHTVFPNPSKNSIQIPENFIGKMYSIINLNGTSLQRDKVINSLIDISSLAAGTYLLKIDCETQYESIKFVKD